MNFGSIFEKVTSDGHLPIGLFVFIVGAVIHVFHGLDASFVAFTTTVLGFLGTHAWVQGKYSGGTNGDSGSGSDQANKG